MIYVKSARNDVVRLKDNDIYSRCPVCEAEVQVDYDVFASIVIDGEMEESSVYCDTCSDNYHDGLKPKIFRIK